MGRNIGPPPRPPPRQSKYPILRHYQGQFHLVFPKGSFHQGKFHPDFQQVEFRRDLSPLRGFLANTQISPAFFYRQSYRQSNSRLRSDEQNRIILVHPSTPFLGHCAHPSKSFTPGLCRNTIDTTSTAQAQASRERPTNKHNKYTSSQSLGGAANHQPKSIYKKVSICQGSGHGQKDTTYSCT